MPRCLPSSLRSVQLPLDHLVEMRVRNVCHQRRNGRRSDKHTAQIQQELTCTQRCILQLEQEVLERQEGTEEVEQGTLTNSTPACQIAKMSKLISKISIFIWKCDLTLQTKINSIYSEQHPILKSAVSLTGSLLTQMLIINCFKKPS